MFLKVGHVSSDFQIVRYDVSGNVLKPLADLVVQSLGSLPTTLRDRRFISRQRIVDITEPWASTLVVVETLQNSALDRSPRVDHITG